MIRIVLKILGHCREALAPHGRIVVVERLLPERPASTARDLSIVLSDLNMLRGPGGRERTEQAYRRLLEQLLHRRQPPLPGDTTFWWAN